MRQVRAKFRVERVGRKSDFDQRSFKFKKIGRHRILIGCPKGNYDAKKKVCRVATHAYEILHPIKENKSCPLKQSFKKVEKESREWRWGLRPSELIKFKKPKIGKYLMSLGTVPYIDYDAEKGKKIKKRYLHNFKKPVYALSRKGANWILLMGKFKVRPEGVTG